MSPEIARKVVTLFRKTPRPEPVGTRLTPRELQLVLLLRVDVCQRDDEHRICASITF
jgi:hypothetical protein